MQPTEHYVESIEPDQGDYNRLEHFRRHKIGPPGALYVTLDDVILFQGWAALAATTVRLSIRMLSPRGEVVPCFYSIVVAANGVTPTLKSITNLEGFLLSMSAEVVSGLAGAVWVNVVIQRGVGTSDVTQGLNLLQGYPSLTDTLSWPHAPPVKSIDNRGLADVITVGNPAAGSQYAITVPAGVNWLVRALHFQLVTSAVVANRFVTLVLQDNLGNTFAQLPGFAATASLTSQITFGNALPFNAQNNVNESGLPTELRMPGGWQIKTATANMDAGDQFSGMAIELEIFIAQ